jgi:hypothetical protein
MYVIRHDNESVGFDAGIPDRDFIPNHSHHMTRLIQPHHPVRYGPEQAFPVPDADRHETGPGRRIIIPFEAD